VASCSAAAREGLDFHYLQGASGLLYLLVQSNLVVQEIPGVVEWDTAQTSDEEEQAKARKRKMDANVGRRDS
jgi:hypothetical protein